MDLRVEDELTIKRIDLAPQTVQEWVEIAKNEDAITFMTNGGYHHGIGGYQPEVTHNKCTIQLKDLSGSKSFVMLSLPENYELEVTYCDQHATYPF